jgi:hypothetical protein
MSEKPTLEGLPDSPNDKQVTSHAVLRLLVIVKWQVLLQLLPMHAESQFLT